MGKCGVFCSGKWLSFARVKLVFDGKQHCIGKQLVFFFIAQRGNLRSRFPGHGWEKQALLPIPPLFCLFVCFFKIQKHYTSTFRSGGAARETWPFDGKLHWGKWFSSLSIKQASVGWEAACETWPFDGMGSSYWIFLFFIFIFIFPSKWQNCVYPWRKKIK